MKSPAASGPVALATCAAAAGLEKDDLQVIESLRRRGLDAVHVPWDDHGVDWSSFRLVIVRSTWDYPRRRQEFLAWAEKLPRVLNPASILRWNTDKHYLDDLARAGLPVIPTRFLDPGDVFGPQSTLFVVKPAVSCSAQDTARYGPGDLPTASAHVRRLHEEGRTAMIQPYLPEVATKGEINVIFLGGSYSHAVRRWALPTDLPTDRVGSGGRLAQPLAIEGHAATPAERALAEEVLSRVPGGRSGLLYGRVDLAPGPRGEWLILEVELTEPALFLQFSQGGAERLAANIATALEMGQVFS